jgi:hypothetical protein
MFILLVPTPFQNEQVTSQFLGYIYFAFWMLSEVVTAITSVWAIFYVQHLYFGGPEDDSRPRPLSYAMVRGPWSIRLSVSSEMRRPSVHPSGRLCLSVCALSRRPAAAAAAVRR